MNMKYRDLVNIGPLNHPHEGHVCDMVNQFRATHKDRVTVEAVEDVWRQIVNKEFNLGRWFVWCRFLRLLELNNELLEEVFERCRHELIEFSKD